MDSAVGSGHVGKPNSGGGLACRFKSMPRILIVEDDRANAKLVEKILAGEGYDTLLADDGDSGIAMALEHLPDLILMDIRIPGTDGMEATRRLKADEKTCHIPVIALTAYAMRGDEQRFLAAGCDDYLPKPVRHAALCGLVRKYLKG